MAKEIELGSMQDLNHMLLILECGVDGHDLTTVLGPPNGTPHTHGTRDNTDQSHEQTPENCLPGFLEQPI